MPSSRITPLRLALLGSGRSQKWLADEIGMHESGVSRIVNGLRPGPDTAQAIAVALCRPLDELFPSVGHDGDVPAQTPVPGTSAGNDDFPEAA